MRVLLLEEDRLDLRDVRVHRHVVVGEVAGHDPAQLLVEDGVLVERHADAPHHAAQELRAGGASIEDPAGREDADHSRDVHGSEIGVDQHLGELGAESVHGELLALLARSRLAALVDRLSAGAPHYLDIGVRRPGGRDEPAGLGADLHRSEPVQRRCRIGDRHAHEPVAQCPAGDEHRRPDARRRHRSGRDGRLGHVAVAEIEADLLE